MRTFATVVLQVAIILYTVFHFVTTSFAAPTLLLLLSISGLTLFLSALFYHSIQKFKLPFVIFMIGFLILLLTDGPVLEEVFAGTAKMRNMIGLLVIVPLISYVLQEEPYIEDVMGLFYKLIDTSQKFYLTLVGFTQIISYFLLFGSITMMYQFVQIILKNKTSEAWEYFKGTALLRGFGLSTLWVISIPSFIYAVDTLDASLWRAIMQGFVFAIIGSLLAMIFMAVRMRRYKVDVTTELRLELQDVLRQASSHEVQVKKTIEFGLLFLTLFGSIFLLHGLFDFALMILIPLVILVWMFLFYIYKGKTKKFFTVLKDYTKHNMAKQSYQLSIMIAVGVLIFALDQTDFSAYFIGGLNYIQSVFPFINFLYLLPFIVIILGFCGLGPLTVMVLVAGILQSMPLPYPPELMVLAITSGSAISIFLSPIVMPVIVLSAANGLSLLTNGIKFNWKFAAAFYCLVQVYIQTMYYFV